MTIENKEVCNQCPNHCPITEFKCPRGKMALEGGHPEHGEFHGHGRHPGHHGEHSRMCDEESLDGLLHACGHFLHHRGRRGGGQKGILFILSEKKEMSQKELQDVLQIQPGSLSEILLKLEHKGFITREKDADDRRKSVISLTETRREVLKDQTPRIEEGKMFDVLDEEEQKELKRLLKKLLDAWRS